MMEDEHIDKSAWLPDGAEVVTPERRAKGAIFLFDKADGADLDDARKRIPNLLNFLHEEQIITDQQLFDADTYAIWREIHRNCFSGGKRGGGMKAIEGLNIGFYEYSYILTIVRLGCIRQKIVDYALDMPKTERLCHKARKNRHEFVSTFDSLSGVIQSVRDDISSMRDREREAPMTIEDAFNQLRHLILAGEI